MSLVRQRVRVHFRKQGDLRLISHRDLVTALVRLFRRAGLPLGMTEGFHPRPRISFPSALALGIEGRQELFELELTEVPDPDQLLSLLRDAAPPGLVFETVTLVPGGAAKPRVERVAYELPIPPTRRAALAVRIEELTSSGSYAVARAGRAAPLALADSLDAVALDGETLRFRLRVTGEAAVRPFEVLGALGVDDLLDQGCSLSRTEVTLAAASRPS